MTSIGLGLFRKDRCGGIFHKVDTAVVAFPTVRLRMVAGRTLEEERSVASRAEANGFGSIGGAFGAFHISDCRK